MKVAASSGIDVADEAAPQDSTTLEVPCSFVVVGLC